MRSVRQVGDGLSVAFETAQRQVSNRSSCREGSAACESAWGPDADRRRKPIIWLGSEGAG